MSHALEAFKLKTAVQPNLPLPKALGRRAHLLATKNWWKLCFMYGHDPSELYREITYNTESQKETDNKKDSTTTMKTTENTTAACNAEAADSLRATTMSPVESGSVSQSSLNDGAKLFPRNMPSVRRSRRRIVAKTAASDEAADSAEQTAKKTKISNGVVLHRVDSSCHKSSLSRVTKLTPRKLKAAPNYGQRRPHCRRTPFSENNATLMDCKREAKCCNKERRNKCRAHSQNISSEKPLAGNNVKRRGAPSASNPPISARCHNHSKQALGAEQQQKQEQLAGIQAQGPERQQQHQCEIAQQAKQLARTQQQFAKPLKLSLLPHEKSLCDVGALSHTMPAASALSCAVAQTVDGQYAQNRLTAIGELPSPSTASQTRSQQSSLISYDLSRSTSRLSCFESLPNAANAITIATKTGKQALASQSHFAGKLSHKPHHQHMDDTFLSSGISCGDAETQSEASCCSSPLQQLHNISSGGNNVAQCHVADIGAHMEDVEDALIEAEVALLTANLRRDEEAAKQRMSRRAEATTKMLQTKNAVCISARKAVEGAAKKVAVVANAKTMSTTMTTNKTATTTTNTLAALPQSLNVADLRNLSVCRNRNAVWMLSCANNNNGYIAPIPDDAQLSDIEEQLARLASSDEVDMSNAASVVPPTGEVSAETESSVSALTATSTTSSCLQQQL